ncbi:uncharacterized protein M421DRAFT_276 [Didymella exigua CBS 183.55]|uniref:Xylanolytic transcriptional activator regulatory domain-containing protein n=1 Tax=Didymella exigua CBS 183.55 TaxID=1150837 RepID=A0A6A5S1X8_9PLEO|nr:uncharacterized protein M421DRAFT_276 [Didymella exigua CBS 183.55]KAF1934122.1 hypothetical protein M421DRAFT_276 [Didymella exigua CBS 183.55]
MGWLICLCLVFSFGCQQLQEHDPEQSRKLGLKYLGFVKSCFRYLLMTTSIVNVQALVLLNIHHHAVGQKSSSWLLIGLAARMATTMGMHRDVTNMEFDPIERNIRRQVWWSIYSFERIVCSILGRPSVIDDRETSTQIPDAPLLEQRGASAEMKAHAYQLVRMSYKIRQRAYFDSENAEERSPSLAMAESLLRECNAFIQAIPPNFSLNNLSTIQPEPRTRVLLMNVYYYYTRCIVSRDFLVQKVERNIAFLEGKPVPYSEELQRTLILSEDCVDSAHQSLQYIMDSADIGVIGYSCLDLFFVYHSILIVCADFLARPRTQHDVAKDVERKETVRAVLDRTREKKLAATYKILSTIALQFAAITGVTEDQGPASMSTGQEGEFGFDEQQADLRHDETSQILVDMSDVQEDWFMNASTNLGLDFFDLHEGQATLPLHTDASTYPELYDTQPIPSEVDDWTSRSLKGMQTL